MHAACMSMRVFNFIHSFIQTETAHSSGRNSYTGVERARVVIAVSYRSKSIDKIHCIDIYSCMYTAVSIIVNISAHRHSSHCDTYSCAPL